MNLNKAIIGGRITADPELKQTQSGISVCSFTVAVNRPKKQGEANPTADFIRCTAFRQTAELVSRGFKKGSNILVCGRISQEKYTDRNGQKRESVTVTVDEVTFIDPKEDTPSEFKPPIGKVENGVYNPYAKPDAAQQTFEGVPNGSDLPF